MAKPEFHKLYFTNIFLNVTLICQVNEEYCMLSPQTKVH